jgi:hypothetical protein
MYHCDCNCALVGLFKLIDDEKLDDNPIAALEKVESAL